MKRTPPPSDSTRIDDVVAEPRDKTVSPRRVVRIVRDLRRRWWAYLLLWLALTIGFARIASTLLAGDDQPRFEALVVAIGQDSVAGSAREVFDSEAFASSVIDDTSLDLSPTALVSERLTLRLASDSNTVAIQAVDGDPDVARRLADAAATAMAGGLEQRGFFTRPLEAARIPESLQITSATLLWSLIPGCFVVLGWSVQRSRTRSERQTPQPDAMSTPDATSVPSPGSEPRAVQGSELGAGRHKLASTQTTEPERSDTESQTDSARASPTHRTGRFQRAEPEEKRLARPTAVEHAPDDDRTRGGTNQRIAGSLTARLRIALLLEKSFGDKHQRIQHQRLFDVDMHEKSTPARAAQGPVLDAGQLHAVVNGLGPSRAAEELIASISGIGPTYGSRLSELGVNTCAQLAGADPASIARSVGARVENVEHWIDQARALTEDNSVGDQNKA